MRSIPLVYKVATSILVVQVAVVVIGGAILLGRNTTRRIEIPTLTHTPNRLNPASTAIAQIAPPATANPTAVDLPILPSPVQPSATPTQITLTPTGLPPTETMTPSPTFTPSLTPSITPFPSPTAFPTATHTPIAGAPPAAIEMRSSDDMLNVLLLGTDDTPRRPSKRTDVIVVVAVNKTVGSVSMLSLPRDLYIYIPTVGYNRINSIVTIGDARNWPGGGIALLKETIRYNFGIPLHGYAKVNFAGFEDIIDTVGGVDLMVDCPLSDYRLKEAALNPNIFANWEWITLDVGIHHMDGSTALWFARSRVTTSDFDRNRRHQILLRAIWAQFNSQNMWDRVPNLWKAFSNTIDTDLTLEQILSLVPIGIQLNPELIESHFIGAAQVEPFTTESGGAVLRLKPNAALDIVARFYTPPTQNQLYNESPRLKIINQSGTPQLDLVAQQRLAWEGFNPSIEVAQSPDALERTIIFDYTGSNKGSSLRTLQRVLGVHDFDVVYHPDPDRTVDYLVILGQSYDTCTYHPWQGWEQVN